MVPSTTEEVDVWLDLRDYLAHLVKEALLFLVPPCGIDDDQVLGRLEEALASRGNLDGVALLLIGVDVDTNPLREHLQLRDCAWSESISGDDPDLEALLAVEPGELGDGGRLPGALHAEHDDYAGLGTVELERLLAAEHLVELLVEYLDYLVLPRHPAYWLLFERSLLDVLCHGEDEPDIDI